MSLPASLRPRSLSDHALEGDKFVRLVYMDEAGISKSEPMLAVGAVIVHADTQLIATERHLDRLVEQWIPEAHREGFIFHAKELFNGGGSVFKRDNPAWNRERRFDLAMALAQIPKRQGLRLGLGVVDKQPYDQRADLAAPWEKASEAEKAIFLHAAAFSGCVLGVDDWMRKEHPNEVCLLISEDNDQARKTIREVIRYQQSKKAAKIFSDKYKRRFPQRKIKEDPLFQPKRSSSVLQLADFWTYIAKKRFMKDARYERLWQTMRPSLVPSVFEWEPPP